MPHAIVVEDDRTAGAALRELLEANTFSADVAEDLARARALITAHPPDVILADLVLPDGSGLDLLDTAGEIGAAVVVITGHSSVETAVEALRRGVTDYLTKPVDLVRLRTILANVARTRELREEIGSLRSELRKLGRFGPLVGNSAAMSRVYDLVAKVAPTEATVLLVGESGTGKELVARAVHELSRRRRGPFVPVNCGAISPQLIESTLFGHEKGSFTGAERLHRGVFEQATDGTLFLDEITEMPAELQVKLLRVLETGLVQRVGGERPFEVDVRVIAASNRIPEDAVAAGRLREDLWYRLNVFPIRLPPLRERAGDVEALAEHFLAELNAEHGTRKRWGDAARAMLASYTWPGNVRELKNLVQRAFILAPDGEIGVEALPRESLGVEGAGIGGGEAAGESGEAGQPGYLTVRVGASVAEVEQQLIMATLAACKGNKQQAAELLGVSLKTLYNRLAAYKGLAPLEHDE